MHPKDIGHRRKRLTAADRKKLRDRAKAIRRRQRRQATTAEKIQIAIVVMIIIGIIVTAVIVSQ